MQPGFWRKCRFFGRWLRRMALVAVLAAVCAVVWFDRVGLPGFLQRRLVEALRERGLELQFSRLRLSPVRGLVADRVRVGQAQAPDSPSLSARQVELEINYRAAWHRRLEVDGLVLSHGDFNFPLSSSNSLAVTNIQTDLQLQTNDVWCLNNFKADFDGLTFRLSGQVAHAREVADWPVFHGKKSPSAEAVRDQLEKLSEEFKRVRLGGAPLVNLTVTGDARDIHSFEVRLFVSAPWVRTPRGDAREFQLGARLTAPVNVAVPDEASLGFWTNALPYRLEWRMQLGWWRSRTLDAREVSCAGLWSAPILAVTNLSAGLRGGRVEATARLDVVTRRLSLAGASDCDWHVAEPFVPDKARKWFAEVAWQRPPRVRAEGALTLPAWTRLDTNWMAAVLPTVQANGELEVTQAIVRGEPVDELSARLSCSNLAWRVSELSLEQSRTRLRASGAGDERNYQCAIRGALDLQTLRPFLPPAEAGRIFSYLSTTEPLSVSAEIRGHWGAAAPRMFEISGELALANAVVRGAPVDSLTARFSCSNRLWRVTELSLAQFQTRLQANGSGDDRGYVCEVHGAFDPQSLRSILPPADAARVFRHFATTGPLPFSVELRGRWSPWNAICATGQVACTDFAVRRQHVDAVAGSFFYTNRVLEFFEPHLRRGAETMTANAITLDFNANLVRFRNGYSTADPQAVATAIGPKTAEIMEPYRFLGRPTVLVNGCAPLGDVEGRRDSDLSFDVVGGAPFETHKFRATRVTGTIHWLGQNLILTNLAAELYSGRGTGFADFDFSVPHEGADYHFWMRVTNVDLHDLAADVISATNHLAGALSGDVVVTGASTEDWRTVDGYGRAQLRDGLLWDIPIFGFFSTALNQVSPGLGNLRATQAEGGFTITNGVIYSDTLQINMAATRLQYAGRVDLKQNVNARVTAQLLRNIWGVGPVISTVFSPVTKLFEYKVTGTLSDPKYQPLYVVSRLVLWPLQTTLHPFRTLGGFLNSGDAGAQTNSPPK